MISHRRTPMQPEDGRTPMESRWEKSKHAFERILEDSQRATETLMRTLDELGRKPPAAYLIVPRARSS
jgi:hypothetical protein